MTAVDAAFKAFALDTGGGGAEELVDAGFGFLDAFYGNKAWLHVIDLDTFDLESGQTCVLGQLYEHDVLSDESFDWTDVLGHFRMDSDAAHILGFDMPRRQECTFAELNQEWIDTISYRRQEVPA